jgi:hypothetical protein
MRQVSALESTWERRGRDARPGPESVASGRFFCLSLAPRVFLQRAAARILASVPCFVACDALPHSSRYDGGRPSGPHSQLSPASLTPSCRLGAVPGRLPQLGVFACAGTWRSRCARSPRWSRLGSDVAATRGRGQSPWLQADLSASLSLHAPSRGALLRGSWSSRFASLPATLCRTLRATLVGDPLNRIRSSSLPHSPPALDSGLFLVASHNLAFPRALASGDHDAPGFRAGIDLGETWPRRAARPRVRGFWPTFLLLSRFTRSPAARCCADLGLRALLCCL